MFRSRGFTLIELLVVIAIIAILAAILFPVFARARERARQASCVSNVRQIMTAALMYAQDYDTRLPRFMEFTASPGVTYPGGGVNRRAAWYFLLQPYVQNQDLFDCPSAERDQHWGGNFQNNVSYGWNRALAHYGSLSRGFRLRDIAEPSTHQAVSDVIPGDPNVGISYYQRDGWRDDHGAVDDRHNGGANVGFVDGHAKWHQVNTDANREAGTNEIPGLGPWWRAAPTD